MSIFLKYYTRSPKCVKSIFGSIFKMLPISIRYGKVFWDTYDFLQESQWWSKEKLEEYQLQQLSRLLKHAYENVIHYRRLFNDRGIKPSYIQNFNDLKMLPYLTKEDFKKNFDDIVANGINPSHLHRQHTSGTTGRPLHFYEDFSTVQKEHAFIRHQWARVGYKPGDALIQLRGSTIRNRRRYVYDSLTNILRFSPIIDSKEVTQYYIDKMAQFGAKYVQGYPSVIAHFASMIKKYKLINPLRLNAILFSSEAVYNWQRTITQIIFGCRVFCHYGMVEKVTLASECEHNHKYHCLPQYAITEIDPKTNEIIGTSLLNYVNPFIRYKTTDIASSPIQSGCSECSRNYYPIFTYVEGRLEDFIVTPRGVPISPAVITYPFKQIKTIRDTQIIQESLDHLVLKVVPWHNVEPSILNNEVLGLVQELQNILSLDMKIKYEIVKHIPVTKSGKFRWIISKVSENFLESGFK